MLKDLLGCLGDLTEPYDLIDTLGGQVEYLNKYLFLTLAGKYKLNKLDGFSVWEFLGCTK